MAGRLGNSIVGGWMHVGARRLRVLIPARNDGGCGRGFAAACGARPSTPVSGSGVTSAYSGGAGTDRGPQ